MIPEAAVLRLENPVSLVGVDQQFGGHLLQLQGSKKLQALRIWDAEIELDASDTPVLDINGSTGEQLPFSSSGESGLPPGRPIDSSMSWSMPGTTSFSCSTCGCAVAPRASSRQSRVAVQAQGRVGRPPEALHEPRRSPRSRGPLGVGDVAGETMTTASSHATHEIAILRAG